MLLAKVAVTSGGIVLVLYVMLSSGAMLCLPNDRSSSNMWQSRVPLCRLLAHCRTEHFSMVCVQVCCNAHAVFTCVTGPTFRADDLMEVFRKTVIPSATGPACVVPPPPPADRRSSGLRHSLKDGQYEGVDQHRRKGKC